MAKKKKEDKVLSQLRGDLDTSSQLYKQYFPQEPLTEYQDPYAVDTANLLNLRSAYADPHNSSFAGRLSDESRGVLQTFRDRATAGSGSYVGGRSSDIEDIISRFRGGLDGYTSAENTALRESSLRGINSQFATDAAGLSANAANSGIRGGALRAQQSMLERNRQKDRAALEQDIFLKNADEKQNRLRDFSSFMRDVEGDEYNRGREASGDYADLQRYMDETAFTRGQGAINSYEGTLKNAGDTAYTYGQFNIGQKEKTQARDSGGVLGLLGVLGSRRTADKTKKYTG